MESIEILEISFLSLWSSDSCHKIILLESLTIPLTCIGRFKVVLKANEVVLCETKVGLLHRVGKLNLILKFQPNRTYGFWEIAVERFFVFYYFGQYIDKVNEKKLTKYAQ